MSAIRFPSHKFGVAATKRQMIGSDGWDRSVVRSQRASASCARCSMSNFRGGGKVW
jgi:hypothetical protein